MNTRPLANGSFQSLREPLLPLEEGEESQSERLVLEDDDNKADEEEAVEAASSGQDHVSDSSASSAVAWRDRLVNLLHTPLLPDGDLTLFGATLVDSSTLKLLKFLALTLAGIAGTHVVVRWLGVEHDPRLTLSDTLRYESNQIILDSFVFYVIGGLYQQAGVDHVAWLGVCLMANVFSSATTEFNFLKHSVTLFEMHCRWPWQLWVFCVTLVPVVVLVIVWHLEYAKERGHWAQQLSTLLLSLGLFLGPSLGSPYFHLHHWFSGWLLGMHCRYDEWWSRAAMAWCWGLYMNGIGVYGRDPVLTCGYASWLVEDLQCSLVEETPADWRNCSAHGYHP